MDQIGWDWLKAHLEPLMEIPQSQYVTTDADDTIARARKKFLHHSADDLARLS